MISNGIQITAAGDKGIQANKQALGPPEFSSLMLHTGCKMYWLVDELNEQQHTIKGITAAGGIDQQF